METLTQPKPIEKTNVITQFIDGNPIKAKFMTITPDVAKEMLEANGYNRPISPENLRFVTNEMKNGNWSFDGDTIRFDINGNLVNGQHRLKAIVETGYSDIFLVVFNLPAASFKVMDTGKKRSGGDALSIYGVKNAKTAASTVKFVYGLRNGLYSANRNSNRTLSNTDLLEYYDSLTNVDNSVHVGRVGSKKFQTVLSPTIVAGFHYVFSDIDKSNADEFIEKLTTGVDLESTSPIYALRNKLIGARSNERYRLTNMDLISYIIISWNKFRLGENSKMLRIPTDFNFEMV